MAFIRDTRTQRNIGGSGPSGDAVAHQQYQDLIINGGLFERSDAAGAQSSHRYGRLRAMTPQVAFVPIKGRPLPSPVVLPAGFRGADDLHTVATHGFVTKQLKSTQTAFNKTRYNIRIRGGHHTVNEEVHARNITFDKVAGNYAAYAAGISATNALGRRARIRIPGARLDRPNFAGFSGEIDTNAELNNPDFTNSAVTFKNGTPTLHGAKTGGMRIGGIDLGNIVEAALHATTSQHDYSTDGAPDFTMPSPAAVKHHATAHFRTGTPAATFIDLSQRMQPILRRDASADATQAFQGHQRRRNEHEHEVGIQYPALRYG